MLIDEIIALLSAGEGNTTEALLKTKILLHQIGKKELVSWVNNELNGYPDAENVPPYRILPSQVLANVANMAWQATSHPIPLAHLKEEQRETLTKSRMTQSLAALEELARDKEGHVIRPIPMELNASLGKGLTNEFRIQRAWCEISIHEIKDIIVNVRSRLLDFLLELNENLGSSQNESEIKEKVTSLDTTSLFNNAIFGNNTTIVVGNRNIQRVSYTGTTEQVVEQVRKLVTDLSQALPTSGLPSSVQHQAHGVLAELQAATDVPTVDNARVRGGLESLRHVMEHAAGHVIGAGALSLIAELLTLLPH